MTVRAKLHLVSRTINEGGFETLTFNTQYDPTIPEDMRFQRASPWGKLEIAIDSPAALAAFELGHDYYVDFNDAVTPQPEVQPDTQPQPDPQPDPQPEDPEPGPQPEA